MTELPLATAKDIYRKRYWDALRLEEVSALSATVAHELFDTSVNMGTGTATRFLQIALNALNRSESDFPDMAVDGKLGPGTLSGLRKYLQVRGSDGADVLVKALNCQQGAKYLTISAADEGLEAFTYGWLRNRV